MPQCLPLLVIVHPFNYKNVSIFWQNMFKVVCWIIVWVKGLTLFPHPDVFRCLCRRGLLKLLWQRRNCLYYFQLYSIIKLSLILIFHVFAYICFQELSAADFVYVRFVKKVKETDVWKEQYNLNTEFRTLWNKVKLLIFSSFYFSWMFSKSLAFLGVGCLYKGKNKFLIFSSTGWKSEELMSGRIISY